VAHVTGQCDAGHLQPVPSLLEDDAVSVAIERYFWKREGERIYLLNLTLRFYLLAQLPSKRAEPGSIFR